MLNSRLCGADCGPGTTSVPTVHRAPHLSPRHPHPYIPKSSRNVILGQNRLSQLSPLPFGTHFRLKCSRYIYCPPVVLSAKQCLPWLRFPHFPVLHGPGSLAWTGVYQALAFCSWDVPLLKSARWLWISEEMAGGNQDKDVLQVRPAQKVPVKWRGLSIWRENKLPRHLTEQAHRQEIQADSFSMLRPKRKKRSNKPS